MKKISLVLLVIFLTFSFYGCSSTNNVSKSNISNDNFEELLGNWESDEVYYIAFKDSKSFDFADTDTKTTFNGQFTIVDGAVELISSKMNSPEIQLKNVEFGEDAFTCTLVIDGNETKKEFVKTTSTEMSKAFESLGSSFTNTVVTETDIQGIVGYWKSNKVYIRFEDKYKFHFVSEDFTINGIFTVISDNNIELIDEKDPTQAYYLLDIKLGKDAFTAYLSTTQNIEDGTNGIFERITEQEYKNYLDSRN